MRLEGRDVLVVSHRAPVPPLTGAQVKPHHIVRTLSRRGWRVHLRCFGDARQREAMADAWPPDARPCSAEVIDRPGTAAALGAAWSLAGGRSASDGWFASRAMAASVDRAVREHAITRTVSYSSACAQFVPSALRPAGFVELADLDSAKFDAYADRERGPKAWLYRLEGRRLGRREREIIDHFGRCSLVSTREHALLCGRWPDLPPDRVVVMTNGVDVDSFSPDAARASLASLATARAGPAPAGLEADGAPVLVFTGVMDYRPNVEAACRFAEQVMPALRERMPGVRFIVVGHRPAPEVRALAERPGVVVTGFVEDVRPYLARADAAVIPLTLARGLQNKALEAMACGRPVVCTTATHEGIGAVPGTTYLVADTPAQWVDAVERLVRDRAFAAALGEAGRRFVLDHHAWDAVLAPLFDFLEGRS